MSKKSKFFRVATEGATTDGRRIERHWLEQAAANFDPKKYGARVWMEHIRGIYPDGDFKAYGDVTALEVREVEDGKLGLFAQIEPTPELIAMTKNRQKIYTSVEITDKFADTGQAYLIGLGVTDSPASLGTEVLTFAAQHPATNPFASKKQAPGNVFSEAVEVELEFEEPATDKSLSKKVKDLMAKFSTKKTDDDSRFSDMHDAVEELAGAVETVLSTLEKQPDEKAFAELKSAHDKLADEFASLQEQLANEDSKATQRPAATGGKTGETDC